VGANRETAPLQGHAEVVVANRLREVFNHPQFQIHRLGQALRDREHRSSNSDRGVLFPARAGALPK